MLEVESSNTIDNVSLPQSVLPSTDLSCRYKSTLHTALRLHGVMQIFVRTSALEVEASDTIDNMSLP